MKASKTRLGSVIAGVFGLAVVAVLLATRFLNVSAPSDQPASPAAAALPAGVCPYSTDNMPVAEATKMLAKLVMFDVALASDPYFPFKGSLGSTMARQQPVRVANYFWITVAAGNFQNDFPRPPGGKASDSFKYLVIYGPADTCNMPGGYSTEGLGAWPAWFDSMNSLSTRTIK